MINYLQKKIQAGCLTIHLRQGQQRLDELLQFASRENPKRGYLFVSTVLGKHIPVKPKKMRSIYNELAVLCHINKNSYVIGMAETATGLGAGVADSLARLYPACEVFYQHTTRHQLDAPIWLTLDEIHSHAVDHILYQPKKTLIKGITASQTLILVDDEISTGRTLYRLASQVIKQLPQLKEIIIVSLVSWLDNKKNPFADLGIPVRFVNLLSGHFEFNQDDGFNPQLPDNIDQGLCTDPSRDDLGRTALKMPLLLSEQKKEKFIGSTNQKNLTIVGTGEHLYQPFLIAEAIEKKGYEVLFQSTTRSPIMMGDAIKQKRVFSDQGKKTVNYIYNLPEDSPVTVICETEQGYQQNGLIRLLTD